MSGPSTEPKKKPSMMRMPTGVKKEKPKSEEDDDFDMSMLNADQLARLKRAFGIFDKDDSGTISSQEMMQVRSSARAALPRAALLPAPPWA